MQLYFARHAQSLNNSLEGHADYYTRRVEDPGLTEIGHGQADHLAELISGDPERHDHARRHRIFRDPWNNEGFGITHAYSSLQRRAVETAVRITEAIDLNPIAWSDLHECGGVLGFDADARALVGARGATREEISTWSPRMIVNGDVDPDGWWRSRPMETRLESAERADRVYRRLLDQHGGTDDRVLLISHSMFYVFFVCRVLGIDFASDLWFTLNNAALSRFDIGDGDDYEPGIDAGWRKLPGLPVRITYLNRMDHLPIEMIT